MPHRLAISPQWRTQRCIVDVSFIVPPDLSDVSGMSEIYVSHRYAVNVRCAYSQEAAA
jgi:hypothetical protein